MISKLIKLFLLCFLATINAQLIPHGTQQIYDFTNEISLNDFKQTPYSSGYRIKGFLAATSLFLADDMEVIQIELKSLKLNMKSSDSRKLEQYKNKLSKLDKITNQEVYLVLENGKISKIYSNKINDISLMNLKRAIASLFQFQRKDGFLTEDDISGTCNVIYQTKSSTKYTKIKTDCSNWVIKVHHRSDRPLDISLQSFNEISYDLTQDGVLHKLESIESHKINVEANNNVGSSIATRITLDHVSSNEIDPPENLQQILDILEKFEDIEVHGDVDGAVNNDNESLKKLIKEHKSDLENDKIGKETSALIMAKLLPIARYAKFEEFTQLLKARSYENIRQQLLDLFGAAQTTETFNAVTKFYSFDSEENFDYIERYLQALAVGTRPKEEIIEVLFKKLTDSAVDNPKLIDTTVQTVAAMLLRYSELSSKGFDSPLVIKIRKNFVAEISKCKNSECKEVYIRSLQNLKDPSTIPALMNIALEGDRICSVAAMKALSAFPLQHFNDNNHKSLNKIFYQKSKKFDSSARTLALDIILDLKPNRDQLKELLEYLISNDKAFEVKTYLLQKLKMIADKCSRFSALLKGILKENKTLNNYNVISQKGLTTALQRSLSKIPSSNETLVSLQEVFNGVLKRGVVEMILESNKDQTKLFTLGIYTNGLSSFVGGSDGGDEDMLEEIPTAGMEISVQGVNMRPLQFFKGQSDLMGHVWSGTASEPTAAYQATTVLQDHEEYIILQNGATVYVRVLGAKSIDLNGQIQFSLWNRNAHTEINKNSGVALIGSVDVATFFVHLQNKFTVSEEPNINVIADIDFYSDIKLCIRLDRSQSTLRHHIVKSEAIIGSKYLVRNSVNLSYKIPGFTMALNQKNNEMCNKIFTEI